MYTSYKKQLATNQKSSSPADNVRESRSTHIHIAQVTRSLIFHFAHREMFVVIFDIASRVEGCFFAR